MRTITTHHDGHGLNETITLKADPPGPGGASHRYMAAIRVEPEIPGNTEDVRVLDMQFQCGPRHEPASTPGVTEAVLYAILLDRLRAFQAGPYACPENEEQIRYLEAALAATKKRADDRAARGVLGTYAR